MKQKLILFACGLIIYGLSGIAGAQSTCSNSYCLPESYLGPGGTVNSQSAHYSENSTAGDLGTGTSLSASYSTQAGFNTTNDPRLSMVVNTSTIGFGYLSTSVVATATATFNVLNYTAHGYSVFAVGNPPSQGAHQLTGMNPATTSSPGTEQYGINLVDNATPNIGTNPQQIPSGSFSYGAASTGYDTPDNFRYVPGEEIAHSNKSSGETDYMISYIANVSNLTPGGTYQGALSPVVVGTY